MEGTGIGMYLKKINILLERGKNRDLKLRGLTGTQLEVLEFLYHREGDGCVLADIASFFDVKHTSVLHVVKILEKKQLIGRDERKSGSRSRRIYLTADGVELMKGMDQVRFSVERRMLGDMTEAERQVLRTLLECVYRNLKETEERRP